MKVTIPAHLSHTGKDREKVAGIDRCIAPLVEALNRGGAETICSCCGHGEIPGSIILRDDTHLIVMPRWQVDALFSLLGRNINGEKWDGKDWVSTHEARQPLAAALCCDRLAEKLRALGGSDG